MRNLTRIWTPLCLMAIAACSSAPVKDATREEGRSRPKIDYDELQRRLGLAFGENETGFREMKFDACDLGEALSEVKPPLSDCRQAYFTAIRYQLSCRSEDQPEGVLSASDLSPLAHRNLKFTLDRAQGSTRTNAQGEGVIRAISRASQKNVYLKISDGTRFMMLRANSVRSIVTPPDWCP